MQRDWTSCGRSRRIRSSKVTPSTNKRAIDFNAGIGFKRASFDLEAYVSCRCRRELTIHGTSPVFADREIARTRFRRTTTLPHGQPCMHPPGWHFRRGSQSTWQMAEIGDAVLPSPCPARRAPSTISPFVAM